MSSIEWTHEIITALRNISDKSEEHKLEHIKRSNSRKKIYNYLTMAGIVTGPLISIVAGSSLYFDSEYIDITISGLGLLSGVIVSIIKFGHHADETKSHKDAASGYAALQSSITNHLLVSDNERLSARTYLEWTQTRYDELFRKSPLLPYTNYKNNVCLSDDDVLNTPKPSLPIDSSDKMLQYEIERMRRV
jgi:hypothetical protein